MLGSLEQSNTTKNAHRQVMTVDITISLIGISNPQDWINTELLSRRIHHMFVLPLIRDHANDK